MSSTTEGTVPLIKDHPSVARTVEVHAGPATDPLAWLAVSSDKDEAWYWEVPDDDEAWVGLGTAAVATFSGRERFVTAAHAAETLWNNLTSDAPSEAPLPRLAAGFAFDDELPTTAQTWLPLGASRLVLPALQVHRRHGRTWVTRINDHDRPTPAVAPSPSPAPAKVDPSAYATPNSRNHYRSLVRLALEAIGRGDLEKAVPCRSIHIERRPNLIDLLGSLRSTYPACATLAVRPAKDFDLLPTTFVGATPERLVAVHSGLLHTAALAGSAPRDLNPAIDAALGQGLLTSPKERREHAVVVDAVDRALSRLGIDDRHPRLPSLLQLHGIQHLHTPIEAKLPDGVGLLDLVGALHPTPAVAGYPSEQAAGLRAAHEGMDRGWFAAPVGWMDASGEGEFRVALRTGLISGPSTTLFAGAGVVAGSDPDRELLETDVKLRALLGSVLAASENRP
ncbi:MAG TPA: hypothetical protein DCR10_09185 [Acidimicrobiaceae bacterium]|nr:hypothetical protein [Acidimicrobiaceae bacterium]